MDNIQVSLDAIQREKDIVRVRSATSASVNLSTLAALDSIQASLRAIHTSLDTLRGGKGKGSAKEQN
jgi:hypothetical protein